MIIKRKPLKNRKVYLVNESIVKTPSLKDKKESRLKTSKVKEDRWKSRWSQKDREKIKYGIFHKKGYVMIKGFETKEEAEKDLATWRNPQFYCVREILEWSDEN